MEILLPANLSINSFLTNCQKQVSQGSGNWSKVYTKLSKYIRWKTTELWSLWHLPGAALISRPWKLWNSSFIARGGWLDLEWDMEMSHCQMSQCHSQLYSHPVVLCNCDLLDKRSEKISDHAWGYNPGWIKQWTLD